VTLGSNLRAPQAFADRGPANFAFQVQPLHLGSDEFPLTPLWLSGNTRLTVLPFVMQQGSCARGAQPPCQGLSGLSLPIAGVLFWTISCKGQ
jgi:hypothetical protein